MTAFGLDADEARAVAEQFGVAMEQVRRDHLVSHILAAISDAHRDEVVFFGGTALARTLLPDGRLSEDIDLIALGSRSGTAVALERTLASALRRSHGRISWAPALAAVRDTESAVLMADEGRLAVRLQLLDHRGTNRGRHRCRVSSSASEMRCRRRYGRRLDRHSLPGRRWHGTTAARPA